LWQNSKQNIPKHPRDLSSSNRGEIVEYEALMKSKPVKKA